MRKIIVNNLFVGSFGFDESNIPIEVINFYQALIQRFYNLHL